MGRQLTVERRNEIATLLLRDGNLKVSDLAKQFGVSTETIRKDLIYLDKQGIAQKSYGGAIARNELIERPVVMKELENMEVKSAIAVRALELIPPNGVILLDAGSTNYALTKQLTLRNDLTIFTNSIICLNVLSDSNNQIYAFGGKVRGSSKGIVGGWANQILNTISIDIAFLGSDGFKNLTGPSTASFEEAEFKQHVLARSNQVIILSDNSKFLSNSLFQFCEWKDIYALITDKSEDAEFIELADKLQKSTRVFLV